MPSKHHGSPTAGSTSACSSTSAAVTTPSGRYTFAPHIASITSPPRPARSISFASFNSRRAILHLPGENSGAHSFAAASPGASLSNISTTVSNFSSQSMFFSRSRLAPCAPFGMETTGHLLLCNWLTVSASISPSVMTTIFPPSRQRCIP
jgi:hypothetical protein